MTTAVRVKWELQAEALAKGLTITGLHSVVMLGDGSIDLLFDVTPDANGPLHFVTPLPLDVAFDEDEVRQFSWWLASGYAGETLH